MPNEIVDYLNSKVSGAEATAVASEAGDPYIYVNANSIVKVCEALKSGPFEFNVLQVITGTDYLERAATETDPAVEARIELSYILASYTKNTELILKTKLPRGSQEQLPKIETVSGVWKAANWQERECFDMIGVTFVGHPDHRRILCPDDWTGFPLRKDYVAAESYNGMTIYPENKLNFPEREFGVKQKQEIKGAVTSINNYTIGGKNKN